MTMMKNTTTSRGFRIVEFNDHYSQPCSLQMSSLAGQACVWFGVSKRIDLNTGRDLPDSKNSRMHLTQEQVRELLPYLEHFAQTGELLMTRREQIQATVSDLVAKFLYYDRKEDEDLPRGAIEEAIKAGEITEQEIVTQLKTCPVCRPRDGQESESTLIEATLRPYEYPADECGDRNVLKLTAAEAAEVLGADKRDDATGSERTPASPASVPSFDEPEWIEPDHEEAQEWAVPLAATPERPPMQHGEEWQHANLARCYQQAREEIDELRKHLVNTTTCARHGGILTPVCPDCYIHTAHAHLHHEISRLRADIDDRLKTAYEVGHQDGREGNACEWPGESG